MDRLSAFFTHPGTVYIVQPEGMDYVKIGRCNGCEPRSRIATLQIGCPRELRIILTVPGGRALESHIHGLFGDLLERGEWFRFEPPLVTFVDDLRSDYKEWAAAEARKVAAQKLMEAEEADLVSDQELAITYRQSVGAMRRFFGDFGKVAHFVRNRQWVFRRSHIRLFVNSRLDLKGNQATPPDRLAILHAELASIPTSSRFDSAAPESAHA